MISKSDFRDSGVAYAIAVMIIILNQLFKILFKYLISFIRELKYKKKRNTRKRKKGEKLLGNGKRY